jgi:quinoprotein glucose dehydrogenase
MAARRVPFVILLTGLLVMTPGRASLLAQRGAQNGEWRAYGGDKGGTKYSPLDQITRDNFASLKIAWRWKTPDAFLSKRTPDGGEWSAPLAAIVRQLEQETPNLYREQNAPTMSNFQATPLMVGGSLFLITGLSQGASVDARTGQTRWIYNPRSYEEGTTTMTVTWRQRGVAYWSDGKDERVFWGTGNGYLICVDAKSGYPCPDFGSKGRIDLTQGLPRAERKDRDYLNALLYSVQSPPIVVGDVVINGSSISDRRVTMESIPGWVRAWDVRTGKHRWDWKPIPRPGEEGVETWKNDSWSYSGNANVWSIMSADEELGYVYLPTTTPTNDYYGGHRLGDNLFAESLVCVDAKTGKKVWHFQAVHHGLWDYDFPAAPTLLDIVVDGKPIKAVAQVSKQGFVYTFDRVTGKPVWPIEEKPVPTRTNVPGEEPSKTQPFPTKPPAFEYQGVTIDDLADFTPEIRQMAVEAIKGFTIGPLFTPPMLAEPGKTKGTIFRPSASGGANWSGAGVDPETGMLYVPSNNAATVVTFYAPKVKGGNLQFTHGTTGPEGENFPRMPSGLPLFKPPYSRMTGFDMNRGERVWFTPLGNGDRYRNHPMLKALNLPPLGGDGRGGPLITKTLLVSAISTGGSDGGPSLVAYDKATGKPLASVDLPAGAIGTPMTYMAGGKQYIALTVGGNPPELIAFALP